MNGLVGKKFGKLKVVKETVVVTSRSNPSCVCICECGKKVVVRTYTLTAGVTTSCGCGKLAPNPKISSGKAVYLKNRYNKDRLSFERFFELSQQVCFYCGKEPSREYNVFKLKKYASQSSIANGTFIYNGLDRVNPKLGHIEGNLVPCCWDCNTAKSDMGIEEFREWVKRVYKWFGASNDIKL